MQDGRLVETGASSTAIAWTNFEMRAQGATYEDSEKIMEFGAAFIISGNKGCDFRVTPIGVPATLMSRTSPPMKEQNATDIIVKALVEGPAWTPHGEPDIKLWRQTYQTRRQYSHKTK